MSDKISGIYQIKNEINGKVYIGKSVDIFSRWKEHRESSKNLEEKAYLYKAIRKYGLNNFSFSILEEVNPEELNEREKFWIKEKDSYYTSGKGYNCTEGGDGGALTGFSKESMRSTLIKRYKEKSLQVWNKGKIGCFSLETRAQMSAKRVGINLDEDTKNKIILSNMITAHGEERTFQPVKLVDLRTGKETYHKNVYWLSKWLTGSASYFKEDLWELCEGRKVAYKERFCKLGVLQLLFRIEKITPEIFNSHLKDEKGVPPLLNEQSWADTFSSPLEYVEPLFCKRCLRHFTLKAAFYCHLKRAHKWTDKEFLALEKRDYPLLKEKCTLCGTPLKINQMLLHREFCSVRCASRFYAANKK